MPEPLAGKAAEAIADFMRREKLGPDFAETVQRIYRPLAAHIQTLKGARPGLVIGICGSQGSGKSTGAGVLRLLLQAAGLRVAALSIDDLYLPKDARAKLAEEVHPLLATRGPPGTHDVALGEYLLDALGTPQVTAIPRFDKARDTRSDPSQWEAVSGTGRYHSVRRLVRRRKGRNLRRRWPIRSTIWNAMPIRTAPGAAMSMTRWRGRIKSFSAASHFSSF